MTFGDLKLMLAQDVNRSDKETVWYPIWINRALRRIQTLANFSFMHQRSPFVIVAGQSSVSLGTAFKELTAESSPVTVTDPSLPGPVAELPCEVTSRENLINYRAAANVPTIPPNVRGRLSGLPVFLDNLGSGWTLNIAGVTEEDVNFKVSHYRFLNDLAADTDTNALIQAFPDLVESEIKATAFTALNDPIAASFKGLASAFMAEAVLTDHRRQNRGRVLRMGG
jgi:hypothetical protein